MKEYQHDSGGFCLICETHHSILSDHVHKTENYGQDFLVYEKWSCLVMSDSLWPHGL